jgi:hypothetical protein
MLANGVFARPTPGRGRISICVWRFGGHRLPACSKITAEDCKRAIRAGPLVAVTSAPSLLERLSSAAAPLPPLANGAAASRQVPPPGSLLRV